LRTHSDVAREHEQTISNAVTKTNVITTPMRRSWCAYASTMIAPRPRI
jgi:hypothetical protein